MRSSTAIVPISAKGMGTPVGKVEYTNQSSDTASFEIAAPAELDQLQELLCQEISGSREGRKGHSTQLRTL